MKKKMISLVAIVALIIVGFAGYHYYKNTYQGEIGYAQVPAQVPAKQATKDDSNKTVSGTYSYKYKLKVVKADGTQTTVPVEISSEKPTPLTPNSYVKLEFNAKRVLTGPNNITKDKIPAKVQAELEK
ncbi:YxeA family protein [Latilactobacillus sakei]